MFETLFSERGLSLDRLKVLLEVHDAGGIAKAAPGDPVRQSQYSRQLRELSEYFGVEVARRQGRQLKLTAEGVRLAGLVREQFVALQDFRAECRGESVDYTVAAGDSVIQWLVIPRLAAVAKTLPAARFATQNLRTREIVQQLADGRVDFGVFRKDALEAPLKSAALGAIAYSLVVPRGFLPRRGELSLREAIEKVPFAAHTSDGQFAEKVRALARTEGLEWKVGLVCQSFPQALAAVRSGGFAAVLPKIALHELGAEIAAEILSPRLDALRRDLVLAWNPRLLRLRPGAKKASIPPE